MRRGAGQLVSELHESWRRTRAHLERARALLADDPQLARYQEFLDQNELELALDELEQVGEGAPVEYWTALHAAAEEMGLAEHSARLHRRIRGEGA